MNRHPGSGYSPPGNSRTAPVPSQGSTQIPPGLFTMTPERIVEFLSSGRSFPMSLFRGCACLPFCLSSAGKHLSLPRLDRAKKLLGEHVHRMSKVRRGHAAGQDLPGRLKIRAGAMPADGRSMASFSRGLGLSGVVTPGRFELPTRSLGNCCSIHLSYGAMHSCEATRLS